MATETPHWSDALVALDSCSSAVKWARTQPDYATAWQECPRPGRLLWLAARLASTYGSVAHRQVVRAAAACARTVLHRVPAGELRPLRAIEAAEAWADDPTEERRQRAQSARAAAASSGAWAAGAWAWAAAAAAAAARAAGAWAAAAWAAVLAAAAVEDAVSAGADPLELCRLIRELVPRPELPGAAP